MKLQISQATYKSLSETEKIVIEFLINHQDKALNMSITQIAEATFTSAPTVTRTIQKCGFKGIAELRYSLINDTIEANIPSVMVSNILTKVYKECVQTIEQMNTPDILKTIELIRSAKRILIFARGATAIVAQEFEHFIHLLGFHVILISDEEWMNHTSEITTDNDLIIIFTVLGQSRVLQNVARQAHINGAKVVTITCCSNHEIETFSDIILKGHTEKIMDAKSITNHSRLALMIISRTITEYMGEE